MIDLSSEAGASEYRAVVRVPGAWVTCTGHTVEQALAALTAQPRLRAVTVQVLALCVRCGGHGAHGTRAGLLGGGGQTPCRRCDGSGVSATVAKEVVSHGD